jgi:hypothetical protein
MDRWRPVPAIPMGASAAVTRDRFVTQTGDQAVARTGTLGQRTLGVAQLDVSTDEAAAGKTVGVQVLGIAQVECAAAIARGDRVGSTADGRAQTAISTHVPAGICVKATTAAGQKASVLLTSGLPAI